MMVKGCLSQVEERGAIETAHRLRQHISGVFRLSIVLGMRHDDPAAHLVEAMDKKDRVKPMPAITDLAELKKIINHPSLFNLSPQTQLLHYVVAYTAIRIGGALPAKWSEFDFDELTWTIPRSRMKVKSLTHDFVTPIPQILADKLTQWRDTIEAEPDDFVFASRSKAGHLGSEGLEKAYRETLGLRNKHTPHGWRAAMNTIAQEHEFDQATIDRQLDHVIESEVERAYNRSKRFKQRVDLLNWWADQLKK
jgi:integrase